jgi:hypothetical protein
MLEKTTWRRRAPLAGGEQWRTARQHGQRLALVAAAAASLSAATALAGNRLDQQNPFTRDTSGFGQGIRNRAASGQTFTAGTTGSLDRVAVYLDPVQDLPLEPATIFVDVYPIDANGAPRTDGAAIGSGHAPTSDASKGPGFVTIRLSRPAAVKKGTSYAIVLRSDVDLEFSLAWKGSSGTNLYSRGADAERFEADSPWEVFPRDDYFFKTFVTPPRRHRHK